METEDSPPLAVVKTMQSLREREPDKHDQSAGRKERAGQFVSFLLKLARPDDEKHKDRAAMAALRGSLRGTPADYYRAAQYVRVPFLAERESVDDIWFRLVGGLFGLHPQHQAGVTFGQAWRALRDESGSMDSRFLALLNTRADALPRVLRQMVSLLKTRGVALDYQLLLNHLCAWTAANNWVQKKWARDYFGAPNAEATASAAVSIPTTNGETDED